MDEIGHLYVLANSAMPGLVKVGKTTRSPNERAAELSSATGLPSPFIVVYEQLFGNCSEAESFVHTYLAAKGFRVSTNREFFNAPVNDVVRAIANAPGAINGFGALDQVEPATEPTTEPLGDLNEQLREGAPEPPRMPWTGIFESALAKYCGHGDELQDYREAMRLFRQAATLGSTEAYEMIGRMFQFGKGVPINHENALEYFKEGARRGNIFCNWDMGMLFWLPEDTKARNAANAQKCFSQFRRYLLERSHAGSSLSFVCDPRWRNIHADCYRVLLAHLNFPADDESLPESLEWLLAFGASGTAEVTEQIIGLHKKSGDVILQKWAINVLRRLERLIEEN